MDKRRVATYASPEDCARAELCMLALEQRDDIPWKRRHVFDVAIARGLLDLERELDLIVPTRAISDGTHARAA